MQHSEGRDWTAKNGRQFPTRKEESIVAAEARKKGWRLSGMETFPVSSLKFGRQLFVGRTSILFSGRMVTKPGPHEKTRPVALKLVTHGLECMQELLAYLNTQHDTHPNIIQLLGISVCAETETDPIKKGREMLVMELLSHMESVADLKKRTLVHQQKTTGRAQEFGGSFVTLPLNPLLTKVVFFQLFRALQHCHNMEVCHGDVCPENVLIDTKHFVVKIGDFSSARIVDRPEEDMLAWKNETGTDGFRAPEVLQNLEVITTKIDMWSAGCLLAEMSGKTDRPLFFSKRTTDGEEWGAGDGADDQLDTISTVLGIPSLQSADLYRYHQEPTWWPMLFHYPLPKSLIDLLSRLVVCNPDRRLDAMEASAHPFFQELRGPGVTLPGGKSLPPIFEYVPSEQQAIAKRGKEMERAMRPPRHIRIQSIHKTVQRKWTWRSGSLGEPHDPMSWLPPLVSHSDRDMSP